MYVGAEEDDGEGADFREDAADDVHGFSHWSSPLFSVVGCCPADGRTRADAEDLGDGPVAESGQLGFRSSCLRSLFGSSSLLSPVARSCPCSMRPSPSCLPDIQV